MDERVRDFIVSGPLEHEIKEISDTFLYYNPLDTLLDGVSDLLVHNLENCKEIMDRYVDEFGGAERSVFKRMLIFALRDYLKDIIIQHQIRRSDLFGVEEQKFKELFGYDLELKTLEELPVLQPRDNHYGPSRGSGMDPLTPRGNTDNRQSKKKPNGSEGQKSSLHFQYSILENLHKRLTALEQRMGV